MAEVKFSEFPQASVIPPPGTGKVVGLYEGDNVQFPADLFVGATGATGPQGPQGIPGVTGATGTQGPIGPAGLNGAAGPQGPQGLQGLQGVDGTDGLPGIQGPKGDKGDQGDAGSGYVLIGDATVAELNAQNESAFTTNDAYMMLTAGTVQPIGAVSGTACQVGHLLVWAEANYFINYGVQQGQVGPAGPTGATGAQGPIGLTGPTGPAGAAGSTGPAGPQGIQGATGPQGVQGPQGVKGDTGDTGPQGIQGPMGPQGQIGPSGLTGPAGPGVATGGTTGQILAKFSDGNYDTHWITNTGGGATDTSYVATLYIQTVANQDYSLSFDMPFAGSITSLRTKTQSGTCTVTGNINTVALGGPANNASTVAQTQSHAASNTFVVGNTVSVTISSNAAAKDLEITFKGVQA